MTPSDGGTARPPNILLIMCDQFRYDAIAAHGNTVVDTPNLDRLVRSGCTFRRAYTESPVCVPARACAMAGRYPHRLGITDNGTALPESVSTFATDLKAQGYWTQAIGKMHFRPVRADHGFRSMWLSEEVPSVVADDEYLTELQAGGRNDVLEPHGVRHELYYSPQPSQLPEPLTTTAWTGRKTVEFLRGRADSDEPFLCWTSFIKPHPPFDPPAPWYLKYDPLRMPDPVRSDDELDRLLYQTRTQHRSKWTRADLDATRTRIIKAYYYALVSHVDDWIGRILDALEESGLRDNTLVVFTADHGEYLGDHWSFGKRGFHDSAARIPSVWSMPGTIPADAVSDALVGHCDLRPSFAALAGTSPGDEVDGVDLGPIVRGETENAARDYLIGQFSEGPTGLYLCMDTEHKYVYSAADEREVLLQVGSDETQDHSADPACAATTARLRSQIQRRFAADGYREPLDADGGWRHFGRQELTWSPDDRDPIGRGRQYPRWPEPGRRHPVDLLGSPAKGAAGRAPVTSARPTSRETS